MITVKLVTTEGCPHCKKAKEILERLKNDYKLEVKEIDAASDEGLDLVEKYNIMAAPGIIINDEFFKMGDVSEKEFREKFDQVK